MNNNGGIPPGMLAWYCEAGVIIWDRSRPSKGETICTGFEAGVLAMDTGVGRGCVTEVRLLGRTGIGGGSRGFILGFIIIGSMKIGSVIGGLVTGIVISLKACSLDGGGGGGVGSAVAVCVYGGHKGMS